ncbi:PAQR family membrane homeostasis protein TrhA [Roseomonas sp. HF4]|uniref:PAQR family membrane homeostasis protein TrhA n=1 Tax=Roseomonas sp. HF4 TaxID=2562313 RepID=UPI00148542E8|nr:hemolysin III family protein [Roseomonas sp. HF4]
MSGARTSSRGERLADGCIHLLGLSAAFFASVVLMLAALRSSGELVVAAAGIYGMGLLAAPACSALYSFAAERRWRARLRRFDHAAIFVMIAGTYTPVVTLSNPTAWGWSVLAAVWMGAIVGAATKLLAPDRLDRSSVLAYLALGWAGLATMGPLLSALRPIEAALLAAGGSLYILGVVVHLSTRLRYNKALWHAFVLVAAGCHFVAIYRLVATLPR